MWRGVEDEGDEWGRSQEEKGEKEKRDTLRKTLSEWFDADARKELEAEKEKRGRTMLLEQLAALSVS